MLPALSIAVFNDLHAGSPQGGGFQNPFLTADASRLVGPTVEAINQAGPDLVLIPGDLTHDATPEQLALVDDCLRGITAPLVICKGNHDRETPEAAARFDAVLGKWSRPGVTPGTELGLPGDLAILVLEASWRENGEPYESSNPPLATVDDGLILAALADLDSLRPALLLVVCHYPLISQAAYVQSVNGHYAGHIEGGDELLEELTARSGAVVCFTGHNHHHHIVPGERWLQCATGALAEYPAEFRLVTVGSDAVTIATTSAAHEVLAEAPEPEHPWVAGRPQDRQITWRPG